MLSGCINVGVRMLHFVRISVLIMILSFTCLYFMRVILYCYLYMCFITSLIILHIINVPFDKQLHFPRSFFHCLNEKKKLTSHFISYLLFFFITMQIKKILRNNFFFFNFLIQKITNFFLL